MRSFQGASAWLAAFVIGLPALGLVAVLVALRGRSWELFSVAYLVLFMLAYLAGLILLGLLRFRPDWLRALVAAVAVYAIAPVTPLVGTMTHYPYHVIRCGGLPVVGSDGAAPGYTVPGEKDYAVTPFNDTFFCTEKEAKAADYYHDDF
ncbi:hypothetical protein FE391_22630 [Nonomuraea sp. KC401]|uniref:hypothetical protein n=1 Tax=unclassified Nonomuraea TaxID=2593643 RepID=UPI0010FEDB93|nr:MULTISPECIES: hypothetical protein [unclassified Nonomuraea]NBE96584.1 hypothetical protein [Nonomuraea sp. K271]TLF68301.1 hypothetical protein FE391_22630 [Nonomuraea sp. KC401]